MGASLDVLDKVVEYAVSKSGARFCDVRLEERTSLTALVVNGELRSLNKSSERGACVRLFNGGAWSYSSTTDLSFEGLKRAAEEAAKKLVVLSGEKNVELDVKAVRTKAKADVKVHPASVDVLDKVEVLFDFDDVMRETDSRIVNTNVGYREYLLSCKLVNSAGSALEWEEVRSGFYAYPIAKEADKMQRSYFYLAESKGFELLKEIDVNQEARNVAEEAVNLLSAKKPPSGPMVVISDPSVSGLLAHEVMGHASEADEVLKKRSFLTGVVGKVVASELVTMVDDGSFKGAHGYIPFDSEGVPSSRTVIIEKGIYKGYMHSLETASAMGAKPTGNGRAQDFNRRVWVRMTNTFFEPGDWKLDEMLSETRKGLLAVKALGGMEDPVGGGFQAQVLMGYIIRNGKKAELVRSFVVSGKALEILKTVDAVSKEFKLDGGFCGKGEEDMVPVSSGGPYMRCKALVGGA